MNSKPQLPADEAGLIDQLIQQAYDREDAGDLPGALASLEEGWDALPDPKGTWDYYDQGLTTAGATLALKSGDLSAAARWIDRMEKAYSLDDESSQIYVDGFKARLFYKGGHHDLAYAYLDAQYKVLGNRAFDGDKELQRFHRDYVPTETTPKFPVGPAGWEIDIPAPGVGGTGGLELEDSVYQRLLALSEAGDNFSDLEAPQAAAEEYVKALRLLPEPIAQWEAAVQLYAALGDALLALTQYDEAQRALQYALQSAEGRGNAYVWLRLGDAERGLGNTPGAVEAYTSAYLLAGREVFEDEDEAWDTLVAAGIPTD